MAKLACGDLVLYGTGNGYWGHRGTGGWHFQYVEHGPGRGEARAWDGDPEGSGTVVTKLREATPEAAGEFFARWADRW